jgi:hypothetical protein
VTLDFVDETPSLEDSYADSSALKPTHSRNCPSAGQLGAKRVTTSKIRENSHATSKDDSEVWTPTPSRPSTQIPSPSVANHRIDKRIEQAKNNESPTSEHSITASNDEGHYEESTTLTEAPREDTTHWLPRSYELPFANDSESTVHFDEQLLQSIDAQNEKFEESEYWPYMTVQEAYLMRYFIDKLACWVNSSWLSGSVS